MYKRLPRRKPILNVGKKWLGKHFHDTIIDTDQWFSVWFDFITVKP